MPHLPTELEWQTRKLRIDPQLEAAGWSPAEGADLQLHHAGQSGRPADEIGRGQLDPLPGGPARARRPGGAHLRLLRAGAKRKFDQVYEVYSQRLSRQETGDDFDPRVLPSRYVTDPRPGHAFVYVSTIQRMAINLLGQQAVFGPDD
jgi:hypothetical protein